MLKSLLSGPGEGVTVGVLSAIAVGLIYNQALPSHADIRVGNPNDGDIESARRGAAVKSSALVALVSLVTRDLHTFIIGGATVAILDYSVKHHNAINPVGGKLDTGGSDAGPGAMIYNLPDNTSAQDYAQGS